MTARCILTQKLGVKLEILRGVALGVPEGHKVPRPKATLWECFSFALTYFWVL